jgi:DNA mismatch endonuclease (patch repair protein)
MADHLTKAQRSAHMARIRGKNTRPEVMFRMYLVRRGFAGFRLQFGPHKIDFAWPEKKIAIFIDGCFWHGCPEHGNRPRTNRKYWNAHIDGNMARDKRVSEALAADGWRVMRIRECTIRGWLGC